MSPVILDGKKLAFESELAIASEVTKLKKAPWLGTRRFEFVREL